MQNSSCQRWYFVLFFFWICRYRVHSAKVVTLSGSLDMWMIVWIFGYVDAELHMPKLVVLCLGFWI